MKITLESPSGMVLKNHNYQAFFWGFLYLLSGIALFAVVLYWIYGSIAGVIPSPFNLNSLVVMGSVLAVGILLFLVGYVKISSERMITVTLDKATGRGSAATRGIKGVDSLGIDLSKVRKVVLKKYTIESNLGGFGIRTWFKYDILFVMDGGGDLTFRISNTSSDWITILSRPDVKEKEMAQRVADFIGVPMESEGVSDRRFVR